MKRFIFSAILSAFFVFSAFAQSSTFNDKNVEYTFDVPDAVWKMNLKPTAANPMVEYIYGDRMNGYLEIRKITVKADESLSDVIQREMEQRVQFKPGFVAGKEENFAGALAGRVSNYEYVQAGKNMSGRIYYLKANATTIYALRFTGLRDQLRPIRNQIDSIARTFRVKTSS